MGEDGGATRVQWLVPVDNDEAWVGTNEKRHIGDLYVDIYIYTHVGYVRVIGRHKGNPYIIYVYIYICAYICNITCAYGLYKSTLIAPPCIMVRSAFDFLVETTL